MSGLNFIYYTYDLFYVSKRLKNLHHLYLQIDFKTLENEKFPYQQYPQCLLLDGLINKLV